MGLTMPCTSTIINSAKWTQTDPTKIHTGQLLFEVLHTSSRTVLVNPFGSFLDSIKDSLLVIIIKLGTKTFRISDLILKAINERRE